MGYKGVYDWKDVNGDLGNSAEMTRAAAGILTGMTDGWEDTLQNAYNRREATDQANIKSATNANTGALIDAIRQGKKANVSGPYDNMKVADARYEYSKYQEAQAFKRRAEGRAIAAAGRSRKAASDKKASTLRAMNFFGQTSNPTKTEQFLKIAEPGANNAEADWNFKKTLDDKMYDDAQRTPTQVGSDMMQQLGVNYGGTDAVAKMLGSPRMDGPTGEMYDPLPIDNDKLDGTLPIGGSKDLISQAIDRQNIAPRNEATDAGYEMFNPKPVGDSTVGPTIANHNYAVDNQDTMVEDFTTKIDPMADPAAAKEFNSQKFNELMKTDPDAAMASYKGFTAKQVALDKILQENKTKKEENAKLATLQETIAKQTEEQDTASNTLKTYEKGIGDDGMFKTTETYDKVIDGLKSKGSLDMNNLTKEQQRAIAGAKAADEAKTKAYNSPKMKLDMQDERITIQKERIKKFTEGLQSAILSNSSANMIKGLDLTLRMEKDALTKMTKNRDTLLTTMRKDGVKQTKQEVATEKALRIDDNKRITLDAGSNASLAKRKIQEKYMKLNIGKTPVERVLLAKEEAAALRKVKGLQEQTSGTSYVSSSSTNAKQFLNGVHGLTGIKGMDAEDQQKVNEAYTYAKDKLDSMKGKVGFTTEDFQEALFSLKGNSWLGTGFYDPDDGNGNPGVDFSLTAGQREFNAAMFKAIKNRLHLDTKFKNAKKKQK